MSVQARGDTDSFYKRTRKIVCSWEEHTGCPRKSPGQCYDSDTDTSDMDENKDEIMSSVMGDLQDLVQRCKELGGWQGYCALVTMAECLDRGEACEEIFEWISGDKEVISMIGGAMGEIVHAAIEGFYKG